MIDRSTTSAAERVPTPSSPVIGAALALAGALSICSAPASAKSVAMPAGTPLAVSLMRTVSSHNAHVGDRFTFKVTRPVIVGGVVIVRKGTPGQGAVVTSEGAGRNGKPGKLGLQFEPITAADGSSIVVSAAPSTANAEGRRGTTGAITTATRVLGSASMLLGPGSLLLGPAGMIARSVIGSVAGHFTWGRDVTVDPKTPLRLFVSHDSRIAVKRSGTSADLAYSRLH